MCGSSVYCCQDALKEGNTEGLVSLIQFLVPVFVIAFAVYKFKQARARAEAENKAADGAIAQVEGLFAEGKYEEVIEALENNPLLKYRHKRTYPQRMRILSLEVASLEKLGRIPDAVVALAHHLAAVYESYRWPEDLLNRWIALYNSCDPIPIEKFYFCRICGGLDPDMMKLLDYAVKHGCKPPVVSSGEESYPAVVIHFGPDKVRPPENET